MTQNLGINAVLAALKAAAEPTRLRILLLLARGELNVKDLTKILGQSQPRISRHLRLLCEAGLVQRFPEGSWVYFHIADEGGNGRLARFILETIDRSDAQLTRDQERAQTVKQERELAAQDYFRAHAAEWDAIRSLHITDADVERAMASALGEGPFDLLLDLGTGTGRMLELFSSRFRRGIGLDLNHAMLSYARGNLQRTGLSHCQLRHGDLYNLALADGLANAVIMHQVLHFLSDPGRAILEAARVLAPGGYLLVVDFAPHDIELMRTDFAHERLGFAPAQIEQWLLEADLQLEKTEHLVPAASSPPPVSSLLSKEPSGDDSTVVAATDKPAARGNLTVSLWLARRQGAARPDECNSIEKLNLEAVT